MSEPKTIDLTPPGPFASHSTDLPRGGSMFLTFSNPKTQKSRKYGWATATLHLAPHMLSGINVCPDASAGCIASCLNTSGCGGRFSHIQEARVHKTLTVLHDRWTPSNAALQRISEELHRFQRKCERAGMKPAVRLNATSDLPWEEWLRLTDFHTIQFYDYTKNMERMHRFIMNPDWPWNYYLTFSRSEKNTHLTGAVLDAGGTVAVVTDVPKRQSFDEGWGEGRRVVDGRVHDLRFLDPPGAVVLLSALGHAKKDTSGFVLRRMP